MKRSRNVKPKGLMSRILIGVFAVLAAVAMVVDVAAFGIYGTALDKAFPASRGDDGLMQSATDNAVSVAQQIEEEGATLLSNDGALPLNSSEKINLLGLSAVNPIYGGTGSGGSSYTAYRTDFVTAFEKAGFSVNPAPIDAYKHIDTQTANTFSVDFSIKEPAATDTLASDMGQDYVYTGKASFDDMQQYSDTAVVVLSRKGGEGNDLPTVMTDYTTYKPDQDKHYLELNSAEQSLIDQAKKTFKKVVVVLNMSNAMELGFLENEGNASADKTGDIDAALWVGGIGDRGSIGVANILNGKVNPSGRLADTYPYAVETIPSYYNFDTYEYTNTKGLFKDVETNDEQKDHPAYLLNYQEGIYVGYRYYETRKSYDYTTREGEKRTGLSYDDVVQYPFGYGLSYTNFDWKVTNAVSGGKLGKDDTITLDVQVTNTGTVAGKDVVELYYSAPYHKNGSHIQKSDVVLGSFAKTGEIQPGKSETVTLKLPVQDMASYDAQKYYSTTGSYVLESGDYKISLRSDAHTVKDGLAYRYSIDDPIVYTDAANATDNARTAEFVGSREGDQTTAENLFDDAAGTVKYMDRDTWTIVPGSDQKATAEQIKAFKTALDLDDNYIDKSDKAPTFGAKNGLTIKDMTGLDYDDPKWDKLLDQLTLDDIDTMVAQNGWGSAAVKSVGKNQIYDMDGPAALSYVFDAFMGTTTYKTVTYPAQVVLASSWNTDLAKTFGDAISKEARAWNISGWYAPGANTHRNPFTGRNFEYYSEDGTLGGAMAAATVKAANKNGLYTYIKHFALNERETWRHYGLCTWANEQSMREIYFKPFEQAVKQGGTTAIMSSYNNIGTTWAGGDKALLTGVLRDEWGFKGTVLTDNNEEHGFMNQEVAITAGGTALLYNGMNGSKSMTRLRETASGQKLLREAAHQYLYTVANSFAVDLTPAMAPWRMPAIAGSAAVYVICIIGLALSIHRLRRIRRSNMATVTVSSEGE
ncbi:glycoside hydrolase family 3 N-terminal domain-containing protein [Bifidobacterium sp. SO4]|uniref:glycoside hydrolase family 3 N-terminal domain-containing protein n=1 Tax=Bifidobacterium sp. SO4 TaxID=2809030 RepID=UPI001BDBCE7B|nr:glycoside hydrolase family 3 N-terminal domain-containing protein [Bifidobacterium sp. SO4]MBT1170651.1 glycoside hydrolase family 3 C-terminal domain-containing protein [Bifidobacterium sp. SO4]